MKNKVDSRFRGNDRIGKIPAFAGMTTFAGMTIGAGMRVFAGGKSEIRKTLLAGILGLMMCGCPIIGWAASEVTYCDADATEGLTIEAVLASECSDPPFPTIDEGATRYVFTDCGAGL